MNNNINKIIIIRQVIYLFIFIIKDLRKKSIALFALVILWILMFLLSHFIISSIPVSKIEVDGVLSFSFPIILTIGKVFINQQYKNAITVIANIAESEHQKFTTYTSLKGRFTFEYPSIFTLSEKDFPNSDILFHIDFNDTLGTIHGFVQVWNLPYSLKQFLNNSKANSTLQFKNFISKEVDVDEKRFPLGLHCL